MRRPGATLRAVLYHRVGNGGADASCLAPSQLTASGPVFERQLRHLARCYHPIHCDELLAALRGVHTLPPRAVALTFDDGYRDFAEVAWPLLKRYGVPAVLFVPTAYVGDTAGPFWWDALWQMLAATTRRALPLPGGGEVELSNDAQRTSAAVALEVELKRLDPARRRAWLGHLGEQLGSQPRTSSAHLTWRELRQLAADGVTIAAHSRTHELLDQLPANELRMEVAGSRDDLVRELGACPPVFAYPNGNANRRVLGAVRAAGFEAAFSVKRGISRIPGSDPLLLRRDHGALGRARLALALLAPIATVRTHLTPLPA